MNLTHKICRCSYLYSVLEQRWHSRKSKSKLQIFTNIFLDVVLAYLVRSLVMQNALLHRNSNLTEQMLTLRDETHTFLTELIHWLMGVPAGLKLNRELSHFLGNFFLSHINIWIGYLHVVEAYLPTMLRMGEYASYFGLSFILAISNDVIGVLTCHIYCFYVYAAKLYCIQLQALQSLARLFVGKKWNVLRLRVDSVTYEADQLILGTLLFTILLFLLPTSLLYYVVFTSLRVLVLLVQIALNGPVHLLIHFPAACVIERMFNDLQSAVKNVVWKDGKQRNVRDEVAYSELLGQCLEDVECFDVVGILKKLCTGELVKPWTSLKSGT